MKDFKLYAADPSFASATLLGTFSALAGLGNAANFGQVFYFTAIEASYVRMEILSNHGSTNYTGFVEAAFELGTADDTLDTPTSVPVPSTLALLGAGLTGLGIVARRGKKRV